MGWQRVEALFAAAVELPSTERQAYLDRECGDDEELRREVAELLASDEAAGSFIERAVEYAAARVDGFQGGGQVGKYTIEEAVGEGGFGTVYRGRDPVLERTVAIKTCTARDGELRRRFLREGHIAASLQHPNITTVFDFGHHEGVPFLVQEFLAGEDLSRKIARGTLAGRGERLPLEDRLDILTQMARGLAHAHQQGVLHRDIKPANVRVLPDGTVKLMDFGIAKLLHQASGLTRTGTTPGLLHQAAPDYPSQARRRREADVVAVLVDETGQVVRALLKQRDDSGLGFNEAALTAAREPSFEPANREGQEGRMWTELPFAFRLD